MAATLMTAAALSAAAGLGGLSPRSRSSRGWADSVDDGASTAPTGEPENENEHGAGASPAYSVVPVRPPRQRRPRTEAEKAQRRARYDPAARRAYYDEHRAAEDAATYAWRAEHREAHLERSRQWRAMDRARKAAAGIPRPDARAPARAAAAALAATIAAAAVPAC